MRTCCLPPFSMASSSRLMVTCNDSIDGVRGCCCSLWMSQRSMCQAPAEEPLVSFVGPGYCPGYRLGIYLSKQQSNYLIFALQRKGVHTLEGTIWPCLIISATMLPSGVPDFMWARSRSPALRCRRPNSSTIFAHCSAKHTTTQQQHTPVFLVCALPRYLTRPPLALETEAPYGVQFIKWDLPACQQTDLQIMITQNCLAKDTD